jgi:hypothetical protein
LIAEKGKNVDDRNKSGHDKPVGSISTHPVLERVPEKWKPVFRKGHATTMNLEHIPIQLDRDVL